MMWHMKKAVVEDCRGDSLLELKWGVIKHFGYFNLSTESTSIVKLSSDLLTGT